jgi:Tfp pilus assembly protein PilV
MSNRSMRLKLFLFLCRSRSPVPNSGLSMLEVLVAMMVVFLTFMTSLNGLLYAAMFQVKADRQAKAVYWIQQDVERVKSLAASASTSTIYTSPPSGITACSGTGNANTCFAGVTTYNNGFARRLEGNLDGSSSGTNITVGTQEFFGKSYQMIRNATGTNTNPQVLTITYTVREADDTTKVLATLYTEILPAAALNP